MRSTNVLVELTLPPSSSQSQSSFSYSMYVLSMLLSILEVSSSSSVRQAERPKLYIHQS